MIQEEQNKLWNDLSEKNKTHYKEQYVEQQTMYESSVPKLLEELFGKHNLTALTYEDVARELFDNKEVYFGFDELDYECDILTSEEAKWALNCTTHKQFKKICALNRLLNVAKYLNKNEDGSDWALTIEDWDDINQDNFFTLGINPHDNEIHVVIVNKMILATAIVYFRTREIAKQAVQILGEDVIRTALGDY